MNAPAAERQDADRTLRLLVVEDSELDFELLLATLSREGLEIEARRVEERGQLIRALAEGRWDAVLSDHHLPKFSSSEALQVVRATGKVLPFIIVSGMIGEEAAVAAMRNGADDYLVKGRLARLAPALLNAMSAAEARRERLRGERALAASEARLRDLLSHLDSVVEEQRTAIAREIHDDIGGALTAVRLDLSWIERHGDDACAARARDASRTLLHAMQATQRIQRDLRPPVLDAGPVPSLRWLIEEFRRRTGLAARFSSNVESVSLEPERATTVYRTLQESLTNVTKHAEAKSVQVDLMFSGASLSLEIVDDGVGIGPRDTEKAGSYGLRGLAERAERAGGWIDVTPGRRGTCVLLSLPMSAENPIEQEARR